MTVNEEINDTKNDHSSKISHDNKIINKWEWERTVVEYNKVLSWKQG